MKKIYIIGFIAAVAIIVSSIVFLRAPEVRGGAGKKRVLVLGIDGMDPILLRQFVDKGVMPNFKKLLETGDFKPLGSSIPPQSPVAWANFLTGTNPGQHGIFDFIHGSPLKMDLFLSTSKAIDPPESRSAALGNWVLWWKMGDVKNLVHGQAFWNVLADHGIKTRVWKIPSNFPPFQGRGWSSSGMGTPDILGTYGTFSYYTDNPPDNKDEVSGGEVYPVFAKDNVFTCTLGGPKNIFHLDDRNPYKTKAKKQVRNYDKARLDLKVYVDPENNSAVVDFADQEILLAVGDWTDWVPFKFTLIPHLMHLPGMVRFYLKEVRPDFKLYVSPINIDPADPAMPMYNPLEYGNEVEESIGRGYTAGISEDTKSRTYDVLDDGEFLAQSQEVLKERMKEFQYHLDTFDEGLLFFYFSSLDQGTHMFWRLHDPSHPAYNAQWAAKLGDVVELLYKEMDKALGLAMQKVDDNTTLMVMSDHGFASYARNFQLNSWLLDNGYLYLLDPSKRESVKYFGNVDWGRTRAYGLGINGLYINNYRPEDKMGLVRPGPEKDALVDEIAAKLEAVVDPKTGLHPIKKAYKAREVYKGEYADKGPEIIVGYARQYRASWETTLGEFPKELISDNTEPWSGDHCIDPAEVPGVLVTNRKIKAEKPTLIDLAPTILNEFGVTPPALMEGKPVF